MSQKLVSVDFKADFGFFRKPDMNSGIHLSYNIIHKPAVLGILGAIIGLGGYKEKGIVPEYYTELRDIKLGVEPLGHENGNFTKTIIKYSNTVGYANKGTTYLTEESTLIRPGFRVYLLLDLEIPNQLKLYDFLKKGYADFLPYFGKNEFSVWWEKECLQEYEYEKCREGEGESKTISTIFLKNNQVLKDQKQNLEFDFENLEDLNKGFLYFERLPVGFDSNLNQYDMQEFALSSFKINPSSILNLYLIKAANAYVQLL